MSTQAPFLERGGSRAPTVFPRCPYCFSRCPYCFSRKFRPLSLGEAPCLQKKMSLQFWRVAAVVCVQQSACAGAELSVRNCVCAELCVCVCVLRRAERTRTFYFVVKIVRIPQCPKCVCMLMCACRCVHADVCMLMCVC